MITSTASSSIRWRKAMLQSWARTIPEQRLTHSSAPKTKDCFCFVLNHPIGKHRLLFVILGVAVLTVASLPFLLSASCRTHPQTPAERKALESLRTMTRNDVLPSEDEI